MIRVRPVCLAQFVRRVPQDLQVQPETRELVEVRVLPVIRDLLAIREHRDRLERVFPVRRALREVQDRRETLDPVEPLVTREFRDRLELLDQLGL